MSCALFFRQTTFLQVFYLLLAFPLSSGGFEQPRLPASQGSWLVALPNAHITEAPSQELVKRNIVKRDINPCTQWSIVGGRCIVSDKPGIKSLIVAGGQIGCSGTQTCLFTSLAGYDWEYCGDISSSPAFATHCYDYPTSWIGISPEDIAYWLVPLIISLLLGGELGNRYNDRI
jgi:hypothetical protein